MSKKSFEINIPVKVIKRNNKTEEFNKHKITKAVFSAFVSVYKEENRSKLQDKADAITVKIIDTLSVFQDIVEMNKDAGDNQLDIINKISDSKIYETITSYIERVLKNNEDNDAEIFPSIELIQDLVEISLLEKGEIKTAKAYMAYRYKHSELRGNKNAFVDSVKMVNEYVGGSDWKIKENANMSYSLQGLNSAIISSVSKQYWLNNTYTQEMREAHESGDLHIHDLGLLAPYCCGWDLQALLLKGFRGAPNKVTSKPAKHLRPLLGQIVNWLFSTQGESAGAQAISSLDTYIAPFIAHDKLTQEQVDDAVASFVFNLNMSTRVGFQTPFTNVTLDITCPNNMKDQPIIIGGKFDFDKTYGNFQKEMDMFNRAYCKVMTEGDGDGRSFSFPIPTYNVTKEFPWDNPVVNEIMEMTRKFGTPYFANFVNSDMSPEDVRSMCCRLRLDNRELRKRGGGLFGSNPLTGSLIVVTINLARLGYLAKDIEDYRNRLHNLMDIAKSICLSKRKAIEAYTEAGLYPYSKFYLQDIKDASGYYWNNHFNTIGIIGMEESIKNFIGQDASLCEEKGHSHAIETMDFMNDIMIEYQEETNQLFNLEATPGEGTTYRLARIDTEKYPNIITAGEKEPYYTNSTQLPVGYTEDVFEAMELQEGLQTRYTGGTVFHSFLGESISSIEVVKILLQKMLENTKMPYISLTPTYSICEDHGYLKGEQFNCPVCGEDTEVWSRVVGFYRPVQNWNKGKQEEYKDRLEYVEDLKEKEIQEIAASTDK